MAIKLTTEQQGILLHKAATQPRKNQKRFLKDLGGEGTAAELDRQLALARSNPRAVAEAERIDRKRRIAASSIEAKVADRVAESMQRIEAAMESRGMTQEELAEACGLTQPLINRYLRRQTDPGWWNLQKIALALGCRWELKDDD